MTAIAKDKHLRRCHPRTGSELGILGRCNAARRCGRLNCLFSLGPTSSEPGSRAHHFSKITGLFQFGYEFLSYEHAGRPKIWKKIAIIIPTVHSHETLRVINAHSTPSLNTNTTIRSQCKIAMGLDISSAITAHFFLLFCSPHSPDQSILCLAWRHSRPDWPPPNINDRHVGL